MLPITTKEEIRVVPAGLDEKDPATPIYIMAVPTEAGKIMWRKDLAADGLHYPSDEELLDLLEEGLKATFPVEQQGPLLDILDKYVSNKNDAPKELHAEMSKLQDRIASRFPPVRQTMMQRHEYLNLYPLYAARRFLKRVENLDVTLTFTGGCVSDESLVQLDESHLSQAGMKAINHTKLTKAQEKNSPSPSI